MYKHLEKPNSRKTKQAKNLIFQGDLLNNSSKSLNQSPYKLKENKIKKTTNLFINASNSVYSDQIANLKIRNSQRV